MSPAPTATQTPTRSRPPLYDDLPPQWRRPVRQPRRRASRPGNPHVRLRAAAIVGAVVFSLFIGRLLQIQAFEAPKYANAAETSRLTTVDLPATRGTITDVTGVALATTVEARNVTVDQTLITDPVSTAARLAPVLGLSTSLLTDRLTGSRRFAYVDKGITPQTWNRVKALQLPGIFSERTTNRVYPAGELGANLVGFVGADGSGLGGLELSLQNTLSGRGGSTTYEAGADGQQIPTGTDQVTSPVPGTNVRLTIDRDIQWIAQQAIAAKVAQTRAESGTVVVMDPRTGNILAMATAPTFDPNDPGAAPASDRGNRAVTDVYEPGSTSKVMTAAAVIQEGKLKAGSRLTIPSTLSRAGTTFHDDISHGTWHLTLAGVLARSSNLGAIEASEKIGPDKLYSYLQKFGIAQPTGLQFPGESRGLLPDVSQWSGTTFPTVAFGQGLSLNSLQATSVFATIANGGLRVQPRLVAGTVDDQGTFSAAPPSPSVRVVSPATARTVSDMLESVVSDEGTAPMARIPGYRVAGKTGTANRIDPTCGCYRGYTASFIGFAPADAPRLVVSVTLQAPKRGHFGGRLGGPVFKRVMSFALQDQRIPPTGTKLPRMRLTW